VSTLAAVKREDRDLNVVVLLRIGGVDRKCPRIDHVLAVVQHCHVRTVVAAKYLREHLVQHLPFRRRPWQGVDDDAHAIGMLCLKLLGDAQRSAVVRVNAQEE
jgi:hypothetical protein